MGLRDSKAVFLQLQIKNKEMEGKQKHPSYNSGTDIVFFITSNCISVTCNVSFILCCEEKG